MTLLSASDNGGRYNMVHRQTDDGSIMSVVIDGDLVPLLFILDDTESILSASFFPHARLMRGDCGEEVKNDSDDITYSWEGYNRDIQWFNHDEKTGTISERYTDVYEKVDNAVLEGFAGHATTITRKDREYWTPGKTLLATSEESLFDDKEVEC